MKIDFFIRFPLLPSSKIVENDTFVDVDGHVALTSHEDFQAGAVLHQQPDALLKAHGSRGVKRRFAKQLNIVGNSPAIQEPFNLNNEISKYSHLLMVLIFVLLSRPAYYLTDGIGPHGAVQRRHAKLLQTGVDVGFGR